MAEQDKTIFEEKYQIKTYECDFHQNWKPAAFFQHLTEAAGSHAAILGWGYYDLKEKDLFWVLSRMKIQFMKFPKVFDEIIIRSWPKTIQQKLFFIRDFEILDSSEKRLAMATSAWLIINGSSRRLVPPQQLDLKLPTNPDRIGLDEPLEKLKFDGDKRESLRVRAGYSDVDIVGHVNNSRYVEWICNALPLEKIQEHPLDWMQINYDHEIRPGDEVVIHSSQVDHDKLLWGFEGFNQTKNDCSFEAEIKWKG